jgi:D-3-phosphoglycerate dehydrogenase
MQVQVWGSEGSRQARRRGRLPGRLPTARASSRRPEVLSLHLRLNDTDARHRAAGRALSRMKPTALVVNTSRAELIEENALVASLNRGRPGMAAVDVFESEPILQGHPLLRLENAVCTPHIGYVEQDTYEQYFGAASRTSSTSSRTSRATWSTQKR